MDAKTTSKIILGSLAVLLTSSVGVSHALAYITPGEFIGEPRPSVPQTPAPPIQTSPPVTRPQTSPPIQVPPATTTPQTMPPIPTLPSRSPIDLLPIPKLEPAKAGTAVPDARDQIFQTRHSARPTLTRTKDLMPVPARLQYAPPTTKEEEIMNDASNPVAERAMRRAQIVRPVAPQSSSNFHDAAGPLPQSGAGVGLVLLSSAVLAGGLRMLRSCQKC